MQQRLTEILKSFIYKRFLRRRLGSPQVYMFNEIGSIFNNVNELIKNTTNISNPEFETIDNEFALLETNLQKRISLIRDSDTWEGPINVDSSKFIYFLVRKIRPETVVETGVSLGVSTFFILNALNRNNHGKLNSFDILPNAGKLLSNKDKKRWCFTVLNRRHPQKDFAKELDKIKNMNIFIHDSDHSYKNQLFEYESVLPRIVKGGYLLSDDIDYSFAFIDFVKKHKFSPNSLITNKAFGVIQVR